MKGYTSRDRFDERDRYTGVRERMGQVRLDSEANEQADLVRADIWRRSGDLAEGSPDDGFRITDTHLLDPVLSLDGWSAVALGPDDERVIPPQLLLARRDPDTLPHVVRTRGHTAITRRLATGVDLLRLPVPRHPAGATYSAAAVVLQVRFERPPTDDERVEVRVVALAADGTAHEVAGIPEPPPTTAAQQTTPWTVVRVPIAALAPLRSGTGDRQTLVLGGWGLRGIPPRAFVDLDALLAVDGGLPESDLVVRGGDGTVGGAGRIFVRGRRTFLEHDWRYSLQPDLPDPEPLVRPAVPATGDPDHHLVHLDVWEREVHAFQDPGLREPALGGEETAFRTRTVSQVRAQAVAQGAAETLRSPVGGGRLTTVVPAGTMPDRFPPEEQDPCRDRCLFTTNVSTGEGYRGSANLHVRVEVLAPPAGPGTAGVVGWSRENGARVAPLVLDAAAGAQVVFVDPVDAKELAAGDIVVVEDERSRLDGERAALAASLRALRGVNTATGELELEPTGFTVTADPLPLPAGGGLPRTFTVADAAAVRRWDGVDHLLTGVRYNLADGIDFAFSGADLRVGEYWSFTARVAGPDSVAQGVVEKLTDAPVRGPWHARVPLARVRWTQTGREFDDLRVRFLPLHEVRDRLAELGARHLAPGAFTVVVGDGQRTFGDIDQNLAEGVTGDEALQAALDRLGAAGGAIYVRAGDYRLEHPVLVQNRSRVRLLGDGAASRLEVTGAGGAFHVDRCGADGELSIELLALAETPELVTPIGDPGTDPVPADPRPTVPPVPGPRPPAVPGPRPILLTDLTAAVPAAPDLVVDLAARLRAVGPFGGRVGESVVATLAQLRTLQRARPGRPLEEVAPAELDVLRRLPHGVVTVADSQHVRLSDLTVVSRERGQQGGVVAAGVLLTGTCADVTVTGCRVTAPSGVVAAAVGRVLNPAALVFWPRSGLFLHGLVVADNALTASGEASYGVRVADGVVDGLVVTGNRVAGFARGIAVEDAAETRAGEPVDRSVVRGNLVTGFSTVGILVGGDGVDVETNEVRADWPGAGAAPATAPLVQAGIQVVGVANRVRECWVTMAAAARPAPALAVRAGILVGSGVDTGVDIGRPVHDVTVTGNRVDGAGAVATGVLVGGAQPCFDVRIRENSLRGLGDAGVRVDAHAGTVGGVRVEDNAVDGVATDYPSWGPEVVAEVAALTAGVALPAQGDPRQVLAALLAQPTGVGAALDAVLRWLSRATLRGGIVLSLAEDCEVRGNRMTSVGATALPAGFTGPGAPIRTAAVAASGARDLVVEGNRVAGVRAPAQQVALPGPRPPIRPPILDLLPPARPVAPTPARLAGVFGPAVALRREVLDYAAGSARVRQRIGGRIYAAMEALAGALEAGGPESRRLALDLEGGISAMLEAQGGDEHTRSAHRVRAALSRVAVLAAPDDAVAQAWEVAARFDAALGETDAAVVTAAGDVIEAATDLTEGLETLGGDPAGLGRAVVAATGSPAAQAKVRLALATTLGVLAEGRARRVEVVRATGDASLSGAERTIAEGLVRLSLSALEVPDPGELNEEVVESVGRGTSGLVEVLRATHPPLADQVELDFARLRRAGTRPGAEDVGRLVATLRQVRNLAGGTPPPPDVRVDDVDAQRARFQGELVGVTAEQLERRIAGLAVDAEATATRNLRLIDQSVGQLVNLVRDDPRAQPAARAARAALQAALTDVDHRAEHQARARDLLRELAAAQARPTGAAPATPVGSAAPATPAGPAEQADEAPPDPARPLAGLGELLLTLRDPLPDEDGAAAVRAEVAALFDENVARATVAAGIGSSEAGTLLAGVPAALAALSGAATPAPTREAAAHALAGVVEQVAYRATQRPDASPEVRAVHVLAGGLARALDPGAADADRTVAVQRWLASRSTALSRSVATTVTRAPDLGGALAALRRGLGTVIGLPRPVPIPLIPLGILGVAAEVADGVYAVAARRSLRVLRNELDGTRVGATVAGADDHALAPLPDASALLLTVADNLVTRGTLGALDLRPDVPTSAAVIGNDASGCCGAAPLAPPEYGQAVVAVRGTGDLQVAGNRLRDNGSGRSQRPLHELLLDWDGDVVVRDNAVRHAGSAGGGAGVAVLGGPVPAALLDALLRGPALVVEPPPRPGTGIIVDPRPGTVTGLPGLLGDALGAASRVLRPGNVVGVGGFRLATRQAQPSVGLLATGVRAAPPTDLAEAAAAGWLNPVRGAGLDPGAQLAPIRPLLDFLVALPPPIVTIPVAPVRRSVQVAGNDVVARGPALLVLNEGPALVSATVVDNELESLTPTGAVYLRQVDTTVLAANRCECQSDVNVVVVRARPALVSVTGNTVAGAEPAPPTTPPTIPDPPDSLTGGFGDLHLAVPVGDRAALTLKLDPDAVLAALATKQTAFRDVSDDAEATFNLFAKRQKLVVDPQVATLLQAGGGLGLRPGAQGPLLAAEPAPEAGHEGGTDDAGAAAAAPPIITRAVLTGNTILANADLSGAAKLYGMAITSGLPAHQARALVQTQLVRAGGDQQAALAGGLSAITGIDEVGGRSVTERVEAASPVEDIVSLLLRNRRFTAVPAALPVIAPRPPDPRAHSLVVVGGSRVGVVSNATTAGVHVHDAAHSIENNV